MLTPADVLARLDAGAALVQLYTGLIYNGPGLPRACLRAIQQTPAAR
jgi:dihydroorotate dehydrogenase